MDLEGIIQIVILLITAIVVIWQINEMRKSNIATAFMIIWSILYKDNVRKARKELYSMKSKEYKEFKHWSEDEIQNAVEVCNSFDSVGILLRNKVVKHNLVTHEWHYAITACWKKCAPVIKYHQKIHGKDYWDDFQWLYKQSKKYQDKIN